MDHVKEDIESDSLLSGKLKFPINQSYSHISVPIPDDIPKTLARTLNEESSPMSMDFHPILQTLLLVGTCAGSIGLWNVRSGKKLLSVNFKVLDIGACSTTFKVCSFPDYDIEALLENPLVSVSRIMWSPDGLFFGVAFSKHILQVFSHSGGQKVWLKLETDAHVGRVNDLAFTVHHSQLLVITCGSDNKTKVWDVHDGTNVFTIGDRGAAVYSVCPHTKKVFHYVYSTFVDGKMKGWLYDNNNKFVIAVFDYDTPGLGCTKLAYSTDGQRLFSCGTNINGQSFLVEWDESEGTIKRTYHGLTQNSLSVVHFDIIKNQFLAAGDNHIIKFWDMDKVELLGTIDVKGGLPFLSI
ncbi:topless-related protein 1 [Quercus suber]|uniref:Topless-related protein 1 n=1 Tax=Quercus suber TaxID=58331 RepID=A0AAW0JYM1_QUESU